MDKIEKFLRKLHPRERDILDRILAKLKKGNFAGIDVIKLKGYDEIFRARLEIGRASCRERV